MLVYYQKTFAKMCIEWWKGTFPKVVKETMELLRPIKQNVFLADKHQSRACLVPSLQTNKQTYLLASPLG